MTSNARAILLTIGIFFVLVVLNFLFFVDTQQARENEYNADRSTYRTSPYGTHAFYTLLEESGYNVTRLEKSVGDITDRDQIGTLVIISPPGETGFDEEEINHLNEWVEAGNLLVVIDRDIQINLPSDLAAHTSYGYQHTNVHLLQPTLLTRNVERVKITEYASRISLNSRSAVYHIGDDQGAILADTKVKAGRVVMLTDPYIVANNGIEAADNLALALNLFAERPAGKIAFDEYHHGYGRHSTGTGMMAYFRGTPVPWMLAQVVLIAALAVYTYGRRFARPVPLKRERRTTNLEFVSSLANITRLARASDLAMQNIYTEFRLQLCRFGSQPSKTDNAKLAAAVARRARIDESDLAHLLARCEAVMQGQQVNDAELLRLITRIREIQSQISR